LREKHHRRPEEGEKKNDFSFEHTRPTSRIRDGVIGLCCCLEVSIAGFLSMIAGRASLQDSYAIPITCRSPGHSLS
jgi:hypothetical protein